MSEIIGITILVTIFNFVGGSVRWTFGFLTRLITRKPNPTFKEYLYGSKKGNNRSERMDHSTANGIIGAGVFFLFVYLVIKFNI